jgi:hypothetical protein
MVAHFLSGGPCGWFFGESGCRACLSDADTLNLQSASLIELRLGLAGRLTFWPPAPRPLSLRSLKLEQ